MTLAVRLSQRCTPRLKVIRNPRPARRTNPSSEVTVRSGASDGPAVMVSFCHPFPKTLDERSGVARRRMHHSDRGRWRRVAGQVGFEHGTEGQCHAFLRSLELHNKWKYGARF